MKMSSLVREVILVATVALEIARKASEMQPQADTCYSRVA
jgi:hypothetical protein